MELNELSILSSIKSKPPSFIKYITGNTPLKKYLYKYI